MISGMTSVAGAKQMQIETVFCGAVRTAIPMPPTTGKPRRWTASLRLGQAWFELGKNSMTTGLKQL
jgi:hypothetical protein